VLSDPDGRRPTIVNFGYQPPVSSETHIPAEKFDIASRVAYLKALADQQIMEIRRQAGDPYAVGVPAPPPEKPESSPPISRPIDRVVQAAPRKAEKFLNTATGVGSGALKTVQGLAQAVDDPPAAGAAIAEEFSRRQSQRGGILGVIDALTMVSPFSQAVEGYREATVEAKEGNDVAAGESLFKFLLGAGTGASMVATAFSGGMVPPAALAGAEGGTWAGAGVGVSEGTAVGLLVPGVSMMAGGYREPGESNEPPAQSIEEWNASAGSPTGGPGKPLGAQEPKLPEGVRIHERHLPFSTSFYRDITGARSLRLQATERGTWQTKLTHGYDASNAKITIRHVISPSGAAYRGQITSGWAVR
jgi:hypothetical protein